MTEKPSIKQIEDNVKRIADEIAEAAVKAGREPQDIKLMAITKTRTVEEVNAAISAGVNLLGENKVQELVARQEEYINPPPIHFVGHLQTNKVKQLVSRVDMIHSVDRISLAQQIDKECGALDKIMDVLVEVNVGGEASKSGIAPEAAENLIRELSSFKFIKVCGLMVIPPVCSEIESENYFSQICKLFIDMKAKNIDNVSMNVLSMGMSGDFKSAVKHGSNIVRIGSAMFGARNYL